MNGLNLSFKNIRGDQLGFDTGSGVSSGGHSLASTLSNTSYVPVLPPPPKFPTFPIFGSPGSGVSSGGSSLSSTVGTSDAQQLVDKAASLQRFSTGAELVSQFLAGVLKRPTQQIGGQTVSAYQQPQGKVYTEAEVQAAFAEQQRQDALARQNGNYPNGGAGDVVNQIVGFITTNPLAVGGFALAVYLLLKEPPVKRR